jgi:hypothetical protein
MVVVELREEVTQLTYLGTLTAIQNPIYKEIKVNMKLSACLTSVDIICRDPHFLGLGNSLR